MTLTAEVTPLEENKVRLDVAVPEDEVQRRMDRAIRRLGREVRVPGFRPGKAPAEVIVQRVGHDAVVQEMLRGALGDWYSEAVTETGIVPIDEPDLDLESVPDEGDLTFTATVQVRPKATLGDWSGLEIGKAEVELPEGALDAQLQSLRERAATLVPVERAAGKGDFVIIDFDGALNGKVVRQASARDYAVELGGGRLLPEFDQRLLGMTRRRDGDLPRRLRGHRRPPRAAGQDDRVHGHPEGRAGEGPPAPRRRPRARGQRVRHAARS